MPTPRPEHQAGKALSRHRDVVAQVEQYVRDHLSGPTSLQALCRVVGCSERGLRNAFYGVHGMGPKQWMLIERLLRAQEALSAPRGASTTVTAVATEHGFFQLGRFAAIYRQHFGETPSGTLRAASRPRLTITLPPVAEGVRRIISETSTAATVYPRQDIPRH